MGKFYTDFSEYTTGQQPAGWVKSGEPQVEYRIISGTQYTGGKALQAVMSTAPFAPTPLIYSDGHISDVQEVAIRGTVTSFFGASGRIIGCVAIWNFDATNGNGYYGVLDGSQLQIWRVGIFPAETVLATAPAGFTPEAGQMYWVRFQVDASGEYPIVRLKVWPDSSPEPESWGLVHTDTSSSRLSGPGYAGVIGQSISGAQIPTIDVFGYGWDGDPAPMEPPAPPGDVMITPPSIDAAATALAPAVIVSRSATISVPVIGASAAALAPSVQTGRRADVAAPLAAASAFALAPAITAVRRVDVSAPPADAAARAFAPAVTTERAATVRPPLVDASASVLPPIVSTGRFASVSVPLVQASADALAPDVTAGRHVMVRAEIAEAVAQALAPTVDVAGAVTIRPPAASAAAEIMRPAVTAVRQVVVSVPLVEAVAETFPPAVHTSTAAKIDIPVIDVLAEALAPAVSTRRDVRVLVPAIAAAAEVLPPIVDVERAIYLEIGIKLISDGRYQAGISPSRTSLVVLG